MRGRRGIVAVLLNMENRFKAIRLMYQEIPTLSPDEEWALDPTLDNTYKSKSKVTYKTKKVTTPLITDAIEYEDW